MVQQITRTSRLFYRIGQNTGVLLLVNIIGSVIGFFMAAALGRGLGDSGFGQYSLALTWVVSLTMLTEFGLSTVLTRDVAAKPELTHGYLINSLAGKLLLSIPAALLLVFFAPWLAPNQNPEVSYALRWGVIFLYSGLVYSSFTAIFKAHQIMTPILWLTLAGQFVLFAGTLLLLLWRQPLFTLILWHGASQSLQCILAFIFYQKLIDDSHNQPIPNSLQWSAAGSRRSSTLQINYTSVKTLIMTAWPFALAGILAALQMRANILILAYLQGDQVLGWYAAANRFVETGKQLPGAFYAAILPALAALATNTSQREDLQKIFRRARLGLLTFALLASAGALLLGQPVLTLTYGSTYQPATATLQILTLSLIPAAQNSILIVYLYACNDEKFVNWLIATGIVINLSLCVWLIPIWGAAGTALALLFTESALFFFYQHRVIYQR